MSKKFKLLFIGDIVGRSGRNAVKRFLVDEKNNQNYDFIIANAENASHGFGLTQKNHNELLEMGINCLTSGNHIFDKKDILQYIDESNALVRPYNYHKSVQGVGLREFDDIIVINLLGKTFMPPINCPFCAIDNIMSNINKNKIIFVDFHAEATAEKQSLARFSASLGVSALIGTHTHVQTADEQIIDNKLAYHTDAGFCGSKNSVIGMEFETSVKRLLTSINERFEVETSYPIVFNGVEIEFEDNIPKTIRRINREFEKIEGVEDEN